MNLLDSLKNGTKTSQWLWTALLLTLGPYAANLAEPRTFPYDGYHGSYAAPQWFAFALLAAVLCATQGVRSAVPRPAIWTLGGLSAVGLAFGGHSLFWNVALGLILVASAIAMLSSRFPKTEAYVARLLFVGACISCLGLADLLHEQILTELDIRAASAWVLHHVLPSILRNDQPAMLSSVTDDHLSLIQIGLDKLGGMHLVTLLLLTTTVSSWRGRKIQEIAVDWVVILAYALFLGTYLLLANTGEVEYSWFIERNWALAYFPLAIWLALRAFVVKPVEATPSGNPGWAYALTGLALVALGHSWWGPSSQNVGRIVMDDAHGEWETAQLPLDTNVFGRYSVYNYRTLSEELRRVYSADIVTHELTADELRDVSVLILKTPTKPYSDAFCAAVADFVHRGGGLWMIGDHTDAFGISTCMNKVANLLDVDFKKNAWFEPPVKRNTWVPNAFTDPVAKDLPIFLFYTGCELDAPWSDKRVMVARRNILDDADYSAGSFFGDLRATPEHKAGNIAMATLGQRGLGRVACWSDSTLFSNFAIYTPGKLEIALNTIEWLRHRNTMPGLRLWLIGAGAALIFVGAIKRVNAATFLALAFSVAAIIPLAESANRVGQKVWHQEELLHDETMAFFEPNKCPHLPIYMSIDKAGQDFYLSSFISAQRMGIRPYAAEKLSDATSAKTIVLIPVQLPYAKEDLDGLAQWVEQGGNLIVLDGANDGGRVVRSLFLANHKESPLQNPKAYKPAPVLNAAGVELASIPAFVIPDCPKPTLFMKGGKEPVGGWYPIGKGRMFVSSTASLFSDQAAGYVQDTPTDTQLAVIKEMFDIYGHAIDRR